MPTGPKAAPERVDPPARLAPVTTTLNVLAVLLLGFAFQMEFGSTLHHYRAQQVAYADLRSHLAQATAPLGPIDNDGQPLKPGAPIAVLDLPASAIHEVVFEGTTGAVLEKGPGHRRDTVFPGQAGTSVLYGRQATYGGPFRHLARATRGDLLTVTTGQGRSTYKVLDARRPGDLEPPPLADTAGRLTLVTADGSAFLPNGVFTIDADLVSLVQPTPPRPFVVLSPGEGAMASDSVGLIGLVLWSQLLLALTLALTWSRARWGRWQTWVVSIPVLGSTGLAVADQAGRLLPNLM